MGTTVCFSVLEAGGCVSGTVHLTGIDNVVEVERHCIIEGWILWVQKRLKDSRAGYGVIVIEAFCRHTFSDDLRNELKEASSKVYIVFCTFPGMLRGNGTLYPKLGKVSKGSKFEG
jgi:hypothetical protein